MKKIIFFAALIFYGQTKACSWYDPEYEYFNLFTQTLIPNKAYQPFLLTYSSQYFDDEKINLKDENIEAWQIYFNNELTYEETAAIVFKVDIKHLNNLKAGKITHDLLKKLQPGFYSKFKEGIDYLIEAKYLEPYMRINYVEDADSFYTPETTDQKNATQLNYTKTIGALKSLYAAAKNTEIKLRYAYQLIRFQHYTRHYGEAVRDFKTFVEPLKRNTPIYWYALEQKAGAERGLLLMNEANYDFFQVFINSRNRKKTAYTSMKLSNNSEFNCLLKQAKNPEEKNMAYFLLAYSEFSDPVPIMEKMLTNNVDSDILKVLVARSINSLERSYLPIYVTCDDATCTNKDKRLPIYNETVEVNYDGKLKDFSGELRAFISKARTKSDDSFWQMTDAYVNFLDRNYKGSQKILSQIKTKDPQYLAEIKKMQMLNEIVSQPKIDEDFEKTLMQKYASSFRKAPEKFTDSYFEEPDTNGFLRDILANRYFLQGEDGKSFLMNNKLSNLQYNPNSTLVRKVEAFYRKQNKNAFEDYIAQSFNDVGNTEAFFNVIYGDFAMRQADFNAAKQFYEKATGFSGIPRTIYNWTENNNLTIKPLQYLSDQYNGFNNISSLIFGHNVLESYQSPETAVMRSDGTGEFPFIKSKMNKLGLADAVIQLEKIGNEKNNKSAKANQLIGNLLYNTSVLGYFRQTFVMDITNENNPKFHFGNADSRFHFYYKNFTSSNFVEPDNFDLSIKYYKKALEKSNDQEVQARILFQIASAEQGKFYQFEAENLKDIDYHDQNYETKSKTQLAKFNLIKNDNYRSAFANLKKNYANTEAVKDLKSSCVYFKYYLSK